MKFVYPEFLWAFAVLVIPIIIHLFNFRKYKTLYFSSLKFLHFVDQQTRSTQKLKHILVLIARLLAFICLVITFAQPFLPVTSKSTKGGKPVLAIYIDNSFSMSMKGTEGELLSEAREMARKLIKNTSLDTRILLVTNEMSGIEQHLISKPDAIERLDKINYSPISRSISEVIEWQKNTIKHENETNQKIGKKQYIILSDFQKNSSDFTKLKADSEAYYYPVKLSAQEISNLYIDSVWFNSPNQKIGQNNELNIRVRNESAIDYTNVELHLEIEKIKRDIFIDIPANGKITTLVNYTENSEGSKKGKISVNDKQFFFDDDYYFSYSVEKNTDILIINGEDAVKNIGLVYRLDNYYTVQEIDQNNFTSDYLKRKELIVINGAKEIPSGLTDELVEFVTNGGAICLFPGADIDPNTSGWNAFLNQIKMPTLGSIISDGLKIKKINFDDSFFKPVFEKKPEDLNLPSVAKAYQSTNSIKTQSIDLIQFQNGTPLYIKSLGNLNCYLYTSSLASSYGNFLSNALFSTILLRTAELSKRKTPISLIIGEDTKFPIFKTYNNESPIRLKNKEIDYIPQLIQKGGISYISINGIEAVEILKSGIYSIKDENIIGNIALNYNRKESEIASYSPSEISTILENKGIKNIHLSEVSEGQSLTHIDLEKPYEYWKLFLLLTLLFLLTEMALLKFWKK